VNHRAKAIIQNVQSASYAGAPDAIHYAGTLTDPKGHARPWTIAFGIRRNAEPGYELMEVACHEGSRTEFTEIGLKSFPYSGVRVP
jgi:hypothetical protein